MDQVLQSRSSYSPSQQHFLQSAFKQLFRQKRAGDFSQLCLLKSLCVGLRENVACFVESDRCYVKFDLKKTLSSLK